MLREVFAVFEIKLLLSALLRWATGRVPRGTCIAQNGGAKLLVHEDGGLFFGHARMHCGGEGVIDDALSGCNFGGLLRAQCTIPSEHLLLERAPVIKGQNVKWFVKADGCHAVSLDFL